MPTKSRDGEITCDAIKRTLSSVLQQEIKKYVYSTIRYWAWQNPPYLSAYAPVEDIGFVITDSATDLDTDNIISVSITGDICKIVISFVIITSASRPAYNIRFDKQLCDLTALLDAINDGVSKKFGYSTVVKCRQIRYFGPAYYLTDTPHIFKSSSDIEVVPAKFPEDPRSGTYMKLKSPEEIKTIQLYNGLSISEFKKFVKTYMTDVTDNEIELIPDWSGNARNYDLMKDLYDPESAVDCPLKISGIRYAPVSNGLQYDISKIKNVDWVKNICTVDKQDSYIRFTKIYLYKKLIGFSFYKVWTNGKFDYDMISDKLDDGFDYDVKYYPVTGEMEIINCPE